MPRASATRAKQSPRRVITSVSAMMAALALAATVAVPAASATLASAGPNSALAADADLTIAAQKLSVSADAAQYPVVRDSSSIIRASRAAGASIQPAGGWAAPINRGINSPWGPRDVICTSGVGCDSGFHRGDDFAAACETPFYAVTAGVVVAVTHSGLAGDEIVIQHANAVSTAYSHMFDSGILVQVGQSVSAGQNIGLVGSSGDSTGCHLYFEYRVGGLTVDPQPEMASHGIMLRLA